MFVTMTKSRHCQQHKMTDELTQGDVIFYDEKVPDRFRESMKKNRHFTILIYIRSQSRPYHGEAKELRLSVFKVFCMSNVSEFVSSHIKTTGHSDVFV